VQNSPFAQVHPIDAADFITCEKVVEAVAGGGKSSQVVRTEHVLIGVFSEPLEVLFLLLLLNFD
jgi:hypothetical protein